MRAKKIWLFLLDFVIAHCRILSNLKVYFFLLRENGDIMNTNSNRPDNVVILEAKCKQNKTGQVTCQNLQFATNKRQNYLVLRL